MARPPARKPETGLSERQAEIRCAQLVGAWTPAVEVEDFQHPFVAEALVAEAELHALRDRLARRGLRWAEILAELRDWSSRRRLPLTDAARERNGLTTTFGESVLKEFGANDA